MNSTPRWLWSLTSSTGDAWKSARYAFNLRSFAEKSSDSKKYETFLPPGCSGNVCRSLARTTLNTRRSWLKKWSSPTPNTRAILSSVGNVGYILPRSILDRSAAERTSMFSQLHEPQLPAHPQLPDLLAHGVGIETVGKCLSQRHGTRLVCLI